MKIRHLTLSLAILFFCVCGCGQQSQTDNFPKAVKGVIDLTQWDFDRDGPLPLTGEFEFYWNQLLLPQDFLPNGSSLRADYIAVPSKWNGFNYQGEPIGGEGYATYHLIVYINAASDKLAAKILEMSTAFTLFVNGRKLSSAGVVGHTAEQAIPGYQPEIIEIASNEKVLDIVFQVSNYSHKIGGAWEPITLGTRDQLQKRKEIKIAFNLLLFGSIFIIGLYHLGIYSLRRDERSALFFGLFCLIIALRILVTGERYILLLIPDIKYELIIKIEYLTFYLAVPTFVHYFYSLFSNRFSKVVRLTATWIGLFFGIVVFLLPVNVFSHTLSFYQLFTVAMFIYATGILVVASINKETRAIIFLAGFSILFILSVSDMLYAQNLIRADYMVQFGLFIFIFSQAYMLSRYFSDAFNTVETQRKKLLETEQILKETNTELEKRVKERTSEILKTNRNLKREIEERKQAQKIMWKAKRAAEVASRSKSDFLANMSHELRTPMNHIIGFTELILDEHFGKLNDIQGEYLNDVHQSAEHLLSLINDVLDLSKVEAGKFEFQPQSIDIEKLLSGSLMMVREKAMKRGVQTECHMDGLPESISVDERMIKQILYNLLSNAIKFTPDGGRIDLLAKYENGYELDAKDKEGAKKRFIKISVSDTGIGLKKESLEVIFQPFEQVENSTSRRFQGTGLGLSLSKKFVELHGGRIWAESEGEGLGTTICFTLPI